MVLAGLGCGAIAACSGSTEEVSNGACTSRYEVVADAATWPGLTDAMLDYDRRGRVGAVRVQARGNDVGAGDEDAVRVVDLLDPEGRRIIQVDVWRTDAGAWRAGVWQQCID